MRFIPIFLSLSLGLALPAAAAPLDIETVRAMAFDKGIVKLEEVKLKRGVWKVEGEDARGHDIEMEIEAATGFIIKLERD